MFLDVGRKVKVAVIVGIQPLGGDRRVVFFESGAEYFDPSVPRSLEWRWDINVVH